MLLTFPLLRRIWLENGQQAHVCSLLNRSKSSTAVGPHDFENCNWIESLFDTANSNATTSYLEHILVGYPDLPNVVIWD